jgi:hypothetical protein
VPCSVSERRHGPGWHGTRPSSRISRRTQLGTAQLAAAGQHRVDAPVPVLAVIRLEQRLYLNLQQFPPFRRRRSRTGSPVVKA